MNLTVVQGAPVWLPRTQIWMHDQARFLPADIHSHVVCDRTENLAAFPVERLHVSSGIRGLLDRAARVAGLRRHPGLLVRVAREAGARLLHSHFGHVGWLHLEAARRAGLRHVVTFYGQDVGHFPRRDPRWRDRYLEMFRAVHRVLCEGPHMARSIAALGCPEDKLTVQHLGVDPARYAFRPRVWERPGPLRVLLAGTFTEKKGFPMAIDALARLCKSVPVEVTVIGDANREPRNALEKVRIREAIDRSGLAEVRLLGYQSHARLIEEAHAHHIFLSPSRTSSDGDTEGGAPVTILEMAATGMPIVTTDHADIPEVAPHAFRAPEGDPDALLEQLLRVAADPGAWEAHARAGREHVEREYDARRQGERLAAIYRRVCGLGS